MDDYGYIKISDNEAIISRLTWPVWKLVTGRNDRAEWAIHEKPDDPVKFAEQVFLSSKEKGDKLDSVTIVVCDDTYIKNMYNNGKQVCPETAKRWAYTVYCDGIEDADSLFEYNGAGNVTRPAILLFNVELKVNVTHAFKALMTYKTYSCLCDWSKRLFGVECYIPPYYMSADTLLSEYGNIVSEECAFSQQMETAVVKDRAINFYDGKSVIAVPIFVPETFEGATFKYSTLFADEEFTANPVRDPWSVELYPECSAGDLRTTGVTEDIANLFGCAKSVKPVGRFEKIDNLAFRAGLPYDGFYDAIKGEMERVFAVNRRGTLAYLEL